MNKVIKIIGLFVSIVAGLFLFGCDGKDGKELVMGCSAEYPPFEFRSNGELVGFDVDLAKLIAKKLGYKLEIKDMKFDGLIGALNSGVVDFIMSGMTVTPEREKRVDFSQMYYDPKFAVVYNKASGEEIDIPDQMKGKKMGAQIGSTMEMFIKEKIAKLGKIHYKGMARNPELIQELKVGRLDGIVMEESQAVEFVKANKELGYTVWEESTGEGYAIAFPKGSALKEKFGAVLEELRASGELEALSKQWGL